MLRRTSMRTAGSHLPTPTKNAPSHSTRLSLPLSSSLPLQSSPGTRGRSVCHVNGTVYIPPGSKSEAVVSSRMAYQFNNRDVLYKVVKAVGNSIDTDSLVAKLTPILYVTPGTSENNLLRELSGKVWTFGKLAKDYGLTLKGQPLNDPAIDRLDFLSPVSKRLVKHILKGDDSIRLTDEERIVTTFEISDLFQRMAAWTDPKGERFGGEHTQYRVDANRSYQGQRTHPARGQGVFLENDAGTQIALQVGLPPGSGTSGSASNMVHGLKKLGALDGAASLFEWVKPLTDLGHGYLAGGVRIEIIDLATGESRMDTVPGIVGQAIETNNRNTIVTTWKPPTSADDNPYKSAEECLGALTRVGAGQTHTRIEVLNGVSGTLALLDAGASGGDMTGLFKKNAEETVKIYDVTRSAEKV